MMKVQFKSVSGAREGRLWRAACLAMVMTVAGAVAPAAAIDYGKRQGDLKALSKVFGELHHLRRMCKPSRETDLWRERMKQLVSLEQPTASLRRHLIAQFNSGYTKAQQRFDRCSPEARDYAAARASDGQALSSRLAGGLPE